MFRSSHFQKQLWLFLASLVFLTGCAQQRFSSEELASSQSPGSEEILSNFFKLSQPEASFEQEKLDENRTTLTFQATRSDGTYVTDLQPSDLVITENNTPVTQFQLSSNSQNIVQTVDIVFAVDVTGSMAPTIESAKARLIKFVQTSRARGYHTRMCLLTFGDYTIQNCNKFYDNNPADPSTESQVRELISEISKLRALTGANDPGGYDFNENPMRAMMDASKAPWSTTSQRFAILITDDGFLFSPGNSGQVGKLAPKYTDVLSAIAESKMKIFAATPSLSGYNLPFQGSPSITAASQGEHFLFADLIAGKITLDTILDRILVHARTTYSVTYVSEDMPELDPSLPLPKRTIVVALRNGMQATISSQTVQSNLPEGRPNYKKKWKITDKKIKNGSVRVKINGMEFTSGFQVENGELIFEIAPPKNSKIQVIYDYFDLKDGLLFTPLTLSATVNLRSLAITLNGIAADPGDFIFEKTLEGRWSLRPAERVFSNDDPYQIRIRRGLAIVIRQSSEPEKK